MKVALISCCKRKNNVPCSAEEMYQGTLFCLSLRYAKEILKAECFILSAKYGLVGLAEQIKPYEKTLNTMSSTGRANWSMKCRRQMLKKIPVGAEIYILAGANYYEYFEGIRVFDALKQNGLGYQMQWLKQQLGE